jgi:CRISPR-associated protein Cmr4
MKNSKVFFLYARTSVHIGSGKAAGFIDQPILREAVTKLPLIPGSSIKGVLRDGQTDKQLREQLYGPDPSANVDKAGILLVQDARLLALPVASLKGGWAWVTSPGILLRFARQCDCVLPELTANIALPTEAKGVTNSPLVFQINNAACLQLGECVMTVTECNLWTTFAEKIAQLVFSHKKDTVWQSFFASRLVLVSDTFMHFYSETATEVRPQIRIDDTTGLTADKSLRYIESMPAESLFYGTIAAQRVINSNMKPEDALKNVSSCELQIGGKASTGYGFMSFVTVTTNDKLQAN